MKVTGNTILITGGGSGIGRGLAEAFHKLGNQVVIAGRRKQTLDAVIAANSGMKALPLDIESVEDIASFSQRVAADFPALNVVINNAGMMRTETLTAAPEYLKDAEQTIVTNLLGPIRLTAALLAHLQKQPRSAVMFVSSGLAFVPLAATATYSATKAALHSYGISLRHQLKDTATEVIEIAPPYVQTELTGEHQLSDPTAMPLDAYIAEVMEILTQQPNATEVIVERCKPLRFAAETGNFEKMLGLVNQPR